MRSALHWLPLPVKRRVSRIGDRLAWPVRHALRNPFADGLRPTLVHAAHHRVGTSWFRRILSAIAKEYGLSFAVVSMTNPPDVEAEALLYDHAGLFDRERLRFFRGSHLIRDPRDVVVSGYFYHRWSEEEWLHIPRSEYGGRTYQELLLSLSLEQGLAAEMRGPAAHTFAEMGAWDYGQPGFLEIKYEDLIEDEAGWFERIFRHYGFGEGAVERCVELAGRFSFREVSGRAVGEIREGTHLRSGKPGQWREVFTPSHRVLFRELTGNLVERLGYAAREDR